MKKILIILILSLSFTYSQSKYYGGSMNYSYKGIEWNGDTPLIEHIKDGYKTSKIYKINKNVEVEYFDLVLMYELKNLTNKHIKVEITYFFLDKDNIEIDIIKKDYGPNNDQILDWREQIYKSSFVLRPKEQKKITMKGDKLRYGNFPISKSDWRININPIEDGNVFPIDDFFLYDPLTYRKRGKTYRKKSGLW